MPSPKTTRCGWCGEHDPDEESPGVMFELGLHYDRAGGVDFVVVRHFRCASIAMANGHLPY